MGCAYRHSSRSRRRHLHCRLRFSCSALSCLLDREPHSFSFLLVGYMCCVSFLVLPLYTCGEAIFLYRREDRRVWRDDERATRMSRRGGVAWRYRLSAKTYRSPNIRNNLETFAIPGSFSISQHDTYNRTRREGDARARCCGTMIHLMDILPLRESLQCASLILTSRCRNPTRRQGNSKYRLPAKTYRSPKSTCNDIDKVITADAKYYTY